jgi:hypothetical protein
MVLLINISYANSERYFIKLGSFKNLNGLEKSIERLPNNLRSHIVIVRSNSWYIPFAYYVINKRSLYKYVPKFKRYFPDAHINHSSYMLQYPVVKNYTQKHTRIKKSYGYTPPRNSYRTEPSYQNVAISEADNTRQIPIAVSIPTHTSKPIVTTATETPIKTQKRYKYFSKRMLSGNHYYLAYKSTKDSPNLLIKVSFKNHIVIYQPIIGDMKMTEANYLIENKRLYMFANSFTKDGAYSKLDEHRKNHFLVSSWINGKKLNTLRYYYDLNDAKEYLNLETSNGLANVLEEGSYDEFFLDDEY